jgi:hypothetical protein
VTESQAIDNIWAGIKHALVFAASYSGMTSISAADAGDGR